MINLIPKNTTKKNNKKNIINVRNKIIIKDYMEGNIKLLIIEKYVRKNVINMAIVNLYIIVI